MKLILLCEIEIFLIKAMLTKFCSCSYFVLLTILSDFVHGVANALAKQEV
jgi:hypothetical protein